MSFLFHSIFRNQRRNAAECDRSPAVTPRSPSSGTLSSTTSATATNYQPRCFASRARRRQKIAILTFDDGYFNNSLILPILEEFGVPALFIATDNIRENKCFWWDVHYRERVRRAQVRRN